jgi:hypothetical protein
MVKEFNFMPKKPMLQFNCPWGVYGKNKDTSVCYTTDKMRARLISIALNRFMNSEEGTKWIEEHITSKGY